MDFTLDLKALLTIISILTAITLALIFQWWRNRKELSYQILAYYRLLSREKEIQDRVEISFDGKPVEHVQLMILRVTNTGRQSIDEKDYKKNLDFAFTNDGTILSAEVIKVAPENLAVNISNTGHILSIKPIMLNYKDSFDIKLLLNSERTWPTPDTRIVGIANVHLDKGDESRFMAVTGIAFTILSILIFVGGIYTYFDDRPTPSLIGSIIAGLIFGYMGRGFRRESKLRHGQQW